MLGGPSFSALFFPFESNSTDASHPFNQQKYSPTALLLHYIYIIERLQECGVQVVATLTKQSWKCILKSAAGTVLSFDMAFLTALVTIWSACGHEWS